MKNKFTILILTLMMSMFVAACSGDNNNAQEDTNAPDQTEEQGYAIEDEIEADQVVVKVNGKEVKGSDFIIMYKDTEMMMAQWGQPVEPDLIKEQTLTMLIEQEVLLAAAQAKGYTASEEEVDGYLEEVRANFETEEEFEEALASTPYTLETYKERIANSLAIQEFLENEIGMAEVTDEEIQSYYDDAVAEAEGNPEIELPSFEEAEPQIRQYLANQKNQEKQAALIQELVDNADVETLI
ncbi:MULTISPECIES: SurA N-terminal domain-containing protein [Bacillus]|uniref:SurA N-terminal domain-containing protein n=1 Tax=Bacillus TaxID=1386 RepID=UPI000BB7D3E1|nr:MULTISPECIES: SurA N-terminal domain-containing protein [Bacillus]